MKHWVFLFFLAGVDVQLLEIQLGSEAATHLDLIWSLAQVNDRGLDALVNRAVVHDEI